MKKRIKLLLGITTTDMPLKSRACGQNKGDLTWEETSIQKNVAERVFAESMIHVRGTMKVKDQKKKCVMNMLLEGSRTNEGNRNWRTYLLDDEKWWRYCG
jgi:hypothetical protein